MASSESAVFHAPEHHSHVADEICPLCEQPIPPEKLVEIQQRERDRAEAQERQLRINFAKEKAAAVAEKNSEIAALTKSAEAAAAKQAVDFAQREKSIRSQVKAETETAMNTKLTAVNDSNTKLEATLKQLTTDRENDKVAAKEREVAARAEAKKETEAALAAKIESAEKASIAAEKKLTDEKKAYKKEIKQQRKALEAETATLLAEKEAERFRERDKDLRTIQKLERSLERKTADERGEGSEISLYDELRDAFEDDKIDRVGKGEPGADVIHDVKYKGEVCGRIIYDSKDHSRWATRLAKKLRTDQLAAEAEHAILALAPTAFPADARQIDLREGVILANPARIVALVTLLREHIIRSHRLGLSSHERDEKMVMLYDFMNSDRCSQLFSQFDTLMAKMEDLEVVEKKSHDRTWKTRGELFKDVIRVVRGQLGAEIDRILEENTNE